MRRTMLAVLAALALASSAVAAPATDRNGAASVTGAAPASAVSQQMAGPNAYSVNIMDKNQLGLTISNYGFVGTNLTSRAPSFEYPLGTGFQHLVRGGLWIGAASYDTAAFVGVTTAVQDGMAGSAAAGATEFTPGTNAVYARSSLTTSRYYVEGAVSELDFVSQFADRPAKFATGNSEDHRPLGVIVTQYNFSWSFSDYAHINFFHYVIRNDGPPLLNAWLGMYAQLASGNLNLSTQIPPSGWFYKAQPTWIDSLDMYAENYCLNKPVPANCNYQAVPWVAGIKLLGVQPGDIRDTSRTKTTFACWRYSPGDYARDEDVERYAIMSAGTRASLTPLPDSLSPLTGDPISLIAVGPFASIAAGDSVSVDFAYIGAPMDFDTSNQLAYRVLMARARVAQRAYDLGYLVPVPPPSPRYKIVVRDQAVDYYWDDSPERFIDKTTDSTRADFEGYRLYVGEERNSLHRLAQFDLANGPVRNDTTGYNTGFDAIRLPAPVTIDGVSYQYRYTVDHLRDGYKYWGAITSYDVGTPQIESLESGLAQNELMVVPAPAPGELPGRGVTVFPNPYRVEAAWDAGRSARDHYLWFANLPPQCTLKLYTLAGNLIFETTFDGSTYDGRNARGIYRPGNDLHSNLSGTMFGWDLITREGQAAATGLYLWAVEDKHSGKRQTGKVMLVKSDRENF